MGMRLVVLAVVLGVAGCGGGETRTSFRGDVTFTTDERAAIERGDAFLGTSVGGVPFGVVWDLPHGAVDERTIMRGSTTRNFGLTVNGRIEIDADRADGDLEELATLSAHELGHVRGLPHNAHDGRGVMCGFDKDGDSCDFRLVWTDADMADCLAAHVCK